MEDILKYQRIEGALETIFTKEHVTAANIETDNLILGTADGYIHIINFSGKIIKSVKLYNRSVTAISVDLDAGILTILSCSDNGNAISLVISSDECKEFAFPFNESLRSICAEPKVGSVGDISSSSSGRSFVVGSYSGRLVLHKADNAATAWFVQKDIVLFPGTGSPITVITWQANLVAWADASNVRVMQISSQTAICQISAPQGIGPSDPYPCSLLWHPASATTTATSAAAANNNNNILLIGWGDSFRQVQIHDSNAMAFENTPISVASVTNEWCADCIICGLQLFDLEHIMFLGYSPTPDDQETLVTSSAPVVIADDDGDTKEDYASSATNQPEVIIAHRTTGVYISADTLPLRSNGTNIYGPNSYMLLSSYQCKSNRSDVAKWQLKNYLTQRGGARGCAPICFVTSPNDLVVVRVRDINDRVGSALQRNEFKVAVDLAYNDRTGLTAYQYSDLLRIYLVDMLERKEITMAAAECVRLMDKDPILWEAWIYKFIEFHQLAAITDIIPTDAPRLPSFVYEAVLTALLHEENAKIFLETMKRWSKINPMLFNHQTLLKTLEQQYNQQYHHLVINNKTMKHNTNVVATLENVNRVYFMEALAHLYILSHQHEKALTFYLDIQMIRNTFTKSNYNYIFVKDENEMKNQIIEYRHIFELIEKQNLFRMIENRILYLVKLSRYLSGKLLVSNIDKLPIRFIAQQLGPERQLLLWYLHLIFTDTTARDIYSNEHEFGDLYARQIQLYAEYMPKITQSKVTSTNSLSITENEPETDVLLLDTAKVYADSDLLKFLKAGFAPALLDFALSECEKQSPPLYHEMIYILAQKGNQRKALQLHLTEIGNAKIAIEFIESQLDAYLKTAANSKNHHSHIVTTTSLDTIPYYNDCQLWDDLVDYALSHSSFLNQLLDHLGICKLNPVNVISKIHCNVNIPHLKLRVMNILQQLQYDIQMNQRSVYMLENDGLNLLRRKNQGQRKAIKVDSSIKCCACLRPIVMHPIISTATTTTTTNNNNITPAPPVVVGANQASNSYPNRNTAQIWGPKFIKECALSDEIRNVSINRNGNGAIIFSNNLAFHRLCYANVNS